MTHAEATALRKALEELVLMFVERTGAPVEDAWHLVSDIAIDKWEVS